MLRYLESCSLSRSKDPSLRTNKVAEFLEQAASKLADRNVSAQPQCASRVRFTNTNRRHDSHYLEKEKQEIFSLSRCPWAGRESHDIKCSQSTSVRGGQDLGPIRQSP